MGGRRHVKCCQLASFMTELGEGRGLKGHDQQQQEGVVIGTFKRIKIYLELDRVPRRSQVESGTGLFHLVSSGGCYPI